MGRIGILSCVLAVVSCFGLFAQSLTPARFLKAALEDPYFKSFEKQDAFLRNNRNFSLPWVEELQFRYRDNEFQDMDQRYALRVDPGNPWQISHNKKYFQGIRVLKDLEQRMALKEILKERYEMIAEYWIAVEETGWIKELKQKKEEIGLVLAKKAGSSAFDADQYLNSQIDIIASEADLQEAVLEQECGAHQHTEQFAGNIF